MQQSAMRLSQIKGFDKLPPTVCQTLIEQARYFRLQPDEFLFHQGDVWPYVVFVASGEMRWALLSVSSREHVLFMVRPDEAFWAHSF
ncbi:MAG: cyclic nucleotide-binding domain-containing protein [Chloroflexi bacterium]|nr:cyclic nucleotide-binding domain-containing protein [Chloroflexota bacterium]